MSGTIRVSDTLIVEVDVGADPHVALIRTGAGLVRIEPGELRALVAVLVEVAGRLAVGAARWVDVYVTDDDK